MKYLFVAFTILAFKVLMSSTALDRGIKLYRTDSIPTLKSGFYLAVIDTTKSKGFKVYNTYDYYYLSPSPIVDLGQVDSVYKEYDGHYDRYILHFRLNHIGSKVWFDFTMKHMGQEAAIVLGNKVIWVATIIEPLDYIYLAGKYSSQQIDLFQTEIIKEIQTRETK